MRIGYLVNTIAEVRERRGEVKLGWVKAHMGILSNEAADVIAKITMEGVRARENHKNWMFGRGIQQWVR